MVTTTLQCY
jgi:hypothetical protein